MQQYLVGTGIVLFPIEADCPRSAIETLKQAILARKHVRRHATIGMSLVTALEAGKLNFIVFDKGRTQILAGELKGRYQDPPTRDLARAFPTLVPADVFYKLPCCCGSC